MALQARHRFVIQKLAEAFAIDNEEAVEEMVKHDRTLERINHFFGPSGVPRIWVLHRLPSGEYEDEANPTIVELHGTFLVTDGAHQPVKGKAVYFVKNKRHPDDDLCYTIDATKSTDAHMSFGVVNEPLQSLYAILTNVYRPMLDAMGPVAWGKTSGEQRHEFFASVEHFTHNLEESIKSLSGGLELRKPDDRLEVMGMRAATDPDMVNHCMQLLEEWCNRIDTYLEDSDRSRWETSESGPDTELEYWRSRMQRLTSITEQLRSRQCKMVIGVLTTVTKHPEAGVSERQRCLSLIQQWKQIDVNITEAANEAKDNVKYLSTLERFFEPLYGSDPQAIIDTLPALMNALKMIHTIARYFNTTERMTKLFMKITNQMISTCKMAINGRDPPDRLWDRDLGELLEVLEKGLQLNEEYQENYRITKDKLMGMPKGKQFDFSETQIFGKFDLFCRRLLKLMDMFSTVQQFRCLAEHKLEGLEPLLLAFEQIMGQFRAEGHDLLDFHNNRFDRDYVDFNVKMNELESSLQHFINRSFENITSIEQSLALLKKYEAILHRENLRSDLDSKLTVIFHNYGLELNTVESIYEKHKNSPPIPRNMPSVAGNIMWARHLLRRIEEPMRKFQASPQVLQSRDSKKIVKTYNRVARTLIAFEYLWYEAWCQSVDAAKAGLQATLIIRHPQTEKLYVNFDQDVFQLIREAKCLVRLDVETPEAAKMVLLQEEAFKAHYNELKYALAEYERVTSKIIPVTEQLLRPHLQTLELRLRPGMITLTWTSLNIDSFKMHILAGIQRLEELISKMNDIVENRIQNNLKLISRAVLVNLPSDKSLTLDEFVSMQERSVAEMTEYLKAKNLEVETAVEDLIGIVNSFPLDSSVEEVPKAHLNELRSHFNKLTYNAILNCTRMSLEKIKKRVCSRTGSSFLFLQRPFFEVDVQLSVPSVRLSPSLDDVQRAINKAAVAVLGCSKSMWDWGQQNLPEEFRKSFFNTLGQDIEVIKTVLLLTGALHGTRNQVKQYLTNFRKYDWLWKEDKESEYRRFMAKNPSISDFEAELISLMNVEEEIEYISPMHNIGALTLNTSNLKLQLRNESRQWKVQYSNKVHQQAKESMYGLFEYIRVTTNKLNLEVDNIDSLRYVMNVLKEIRERESSVEMDITPILDMYSMLEHYLPGALVDKEEMDQKSIIRTSWRKLVDYAEIVTNNLQAIQGKYKKQLVSDVREFSSDVKAFRKDFEENGPMQDGLEPMEAVARLRRFKDEQSMRERRMEMLRAGEELFALRPTPFADLVKTRKEVNLLDQLYGLYVDVVDAVSAWRAVPWIEVGDQVTTMMDVVASFDLRCKRLPRRLKEWRAYHMLRQQITDFQTILPLVQQLTKPSIKPRHWEELIAVMNNDVPYAAEHFQLRHILDLELLENAEEVEELCDGADKQLQIEMKLTEIKEQWAKCEFEFSIWKNRDVPILKAYGLVIEELEEAQLQLQTLLSMRHVTPFRDSVQIVLTELSDTSDTLELWVKVQMLWTSLESVFMGGDIAKQMPLEAKKFVKINKDWEKLMHKANETRFVVLSCSNEVLRNTLPVLYTELEKCQKSLEGYLEQKRSKFPRFYFVSNPVLLLILSQGSDPLQMQPYYEKVFDSITHVEHDAADRTRILQVHSIAGQDHETVTLSNAVKASGNIEDWLGSLETEMQRSLKALCEQAAATCSTMPLREFVDSTCGQFALLGLQFNWTAQCQEALDKCKQHKQVMHETNKAQLAVLQELSSWCLQDLGTKMNRTKIETLVTIQVHQRDVFAELARLFKERKLHNAQDFEWLKQTRFYWQPHSEDLHGPSACVISICDVDFKYSHEYLGCKERLVITPLTDRCYITLSQALGMCLGGAPAGPAGTGKTETVKDLGRALGLFVVVTNCTDQQRYTDMAKIFKGLCQAGLWGCFDEFNRIELPVLSVVAQQVLAITNAKRVGTTSFAFPGETAAMTLKPNVGYFITMNPGYQGRQELPENLKVLFRGVAMMVPDREIIMKVKLCSLGYTSFTELSRKFNVLYRLCEQQLSKQKHYDFGLRNILSVLRTAGKTKRDNLGVDEDILLMSTLRDMNLSKLVAQDVPLFLSLLGDLFPNLSMPPSGSHGNMQDAMHQAIQAHKYVHHASWELKVMQLYETTLVRHGIMLVGPAGAGKTSCEVTLQDVLTKTTGVVHKRVRMNPKAIRAEEMFGETDRLSGEWLDGVFAAMWSKYNDRSRKDIMWLVCDGPVDAIWIENLNTVLDDNKILTLANGDRIPMSDNVKLMFEVEDLRNASPATVSRAGIIFVSDSDLDWQPVFDSWLNKQPENYATIFRACFRKYVGTCEGPTEYGHLFRYVQRNCPPVVKTSRVGLIEGCTYLFDGLLEIADLATDPEALQSELERLSLFVITWGIGGLLESEERARFDDYIRSIDDTYLPPREFGDDASAGGSGAGGPDAVADTVFEWYVNTDSMEWERWRPSQWEYPALPESADPQTARPDFHRMLIPTVDSTRAEVMMEHMHKHKHPVLLVGGDGTAKTATALMFFERFTGETMIVKKANFSYATTPGMFQATVEGEMDKRGGKNYGPAGGKLMTIFVDDLSMPAVNEWGDQPTLELVRQLVGTGGFCFLDKDKRGDIKIIEDVQFVAAMNHPSGSRQDIPNRLKRHFFMLNMILPSLQVINSLFGLILRGRFPRSEISASFMSVVSKLPSATTALWNWMRAKMLPSPSKFHYTFNMRELSRVFEGLVQTPRCSIGNEFHLLRLWRHECCRVFADKLTTLEDKSIFQQQLDDITLENFVHGHGGGDEPSQHSSMSGIGGGAGRGGSTAGGPPSTARSTRGGRGGGQPSTASSASPAHDAGESNPIANKIGMNKKLYFVDFLREDEYDEDGVMTAEAPKIYEQAPPFPQLKERVHQFMDRYNEEMPGQRMDLVLFTDALEHLTRISRVLGTPRGSMLLVGVGGSGKQSLTRLASFIAGHTTFQITLTKSYNMNALMDDLRALYKMCGQQGESVTFLFTEAEIREETFLEVINSMLTTGEVANLIPKDELQLMSADLRQDAVKEIPDFVDTPENLGRYFIDRVRSNLHVVLCMSPVSAKFPERARKFPGIINGCTIDWFLPWPEEALVAVSTAMIRDLTMDCEDPVRTSLMAHMGHVHKMVVRSCDEYFEKRRRHVYQTPKSFLSFLEDYQAMYTVKRQEIEVKATRVHVGLEKLQRGAEDVENMKLVLAAEEVKLKEAEAATNEMLGKLEISSMEAKKEADQVAKIKVGCEADADRIAGEKAEAEEDLAKAQPFVEQAEQAVNSIRPNDLNELKKLSKPSDIIKLIFDCVSILKMERVVRVEEQEITLGIGKDKRTFPFIKDSYKIAQTGLLADARFLQNIFYFSTYEKDFINDETVELLAPYLELAGFNPMVARNASRAAEGLCTWVTAMRDYHEASKVVKPKLEALRVAEARLGAAQAELAKAEAKLEECQSVLAELQADFDAQIAKKRAIEENAENTRRKMEQATALINGLGGERHRWIEDSRKFADTKRRLVGDVALACAFVAYCGPFNQDFREHLVRSRFANDLRERDIPLTPNLDVTAFLVDIGTIGDWNLEGLPTDPLSVQNGILVTRSSRFPLLIDPQGQALNWIKRHEADRLPSWGTTTMTAPRLREQLEFCMAEGCTLIVAGVEGELDPMLAPVLEKQIIYKAKSQYINVSNKMCEYNDAFMFYMTTRLPNPHFSPEDQAKTTVVDFTVTQKGLEEQLLGRVIQNEQRSLEEQLKRVLEEVTTNTKALLRLDELLLERLTENTGNLLDDQELITVLADTKRKATEVNEKLQQSSDTRQSINEKREQFRPVATRGSVLYFSIVDMSLVNCMYQTSLDQFQTLFDKGMDLAEKSTLASKRVVNVIETMTYLVYRYVSRGLYEQDKTSFKLMLTLKILQAAGRMEGRDITLLLKAGNALDISTVKPKPFAWLSDSAWLNVIQISNDLVAFKSLPEDMVRGEPQWREWYANNEPEKLGLPGMESRMSADPTGGAFYRLLFVRCLREDRTLLAVNDFLRVMDTIETGGQRLPAMGPRYVAAVTDTVESVYDEMDAFTPVIYLLSAGADPTGSIENLARKKKHDLHSVSMGEGQEPLALKAIQTGSTNGSWVLLQNCHLGLEFMDSLESTLIKMRETTSEEFRLFVTTEPHPRFPIGLLQMCTKVTNEPPKGLKAGLQRSYTVLVDQDKIDRVETAQWRTLIFALCFLHSIVQERRKFGSLGWCIPYEFNDGDLQACLTFLEHHLELGATSWATIQYMCSEVQYGGKITDDMDRRLFKAYTEAWLGPASLSPQFSFNPETPIRPLPDDFAYVIPDSAEQEDYVAFITTFPEVDSPEIFGLHPNADVTFRNKEALQLINTVIETQPKQSGASEAGQSREEVVLAKCEELLGGMPLDFVEDKYAESIAAQGGLDVPLNIFLFQEIQRMQAVIARVRSSLFLTIQAIRGEVVVTEELLYSIDAIFDARVPRSWTHSSGGDEISWLAPSIGLWFSGIQARDEQYRGWLNSGRPASFWLAGFFNCQGFLTAVQQEVTRAHKADKWALDSVLLYTEVSEYDRSEQVRQPPREGVYVHGLSLDGAGWNRHENSLAEAAPKQLFSSLPVLLVTAVTKALQRAGMGGDYGPYGAYECPVYRYPTRTDRYLVFTVHLASRDHRPSHWTMRGTALVLATS